MYLENTGKIKASVFMSLLDFSGLPVDNKMKERLLTKYREGEGMINYL